MDRRLISGLAAWGILLGCIVEPVFGPPPGAYRFKPPAIYQEWHQELVSCVGIEKTFEALKWWAVPGETFEVGGDALIGQYELENIYLVADMTYVEWLVKHEMTHYLLHPIGGHPEPPFGHCEND